MGKGHHSEQVAFVILGLIAANGRREFFCDQVKNKYD